MKASYRYSGSDNHRDEPGLYMGDSSSSQMSRSDSERSTSLSTLGGQEYLQTQYFSDLDLSLGYQKMSLLPYISNPQISDEYQTSFGYDIAAHELAATSQSPYEDAQRVFESFGSMDEPGLAPTQYQKCSRTASLEIALSSINIQNPPGLTNLQPSRPHVLSPFEERLENRINRLWGNYKTFVYASSKGLGVTPLFGRTLSELFRMSRQMAENVCCHTRRCLIVILTVDVGRASEKCSLCMWRCRCMHEYQTLCQRSVEILGSVQLL